MTPDVWTLRKPSATNDALNDAWRSVKTHITRRQVDDRLDQTEREMAVVIGQKKVAFGWSGGKDSIVLNFLCARLGIFDCVWGAYGELDVPAFTAWANDHRPPGATKIENPNATLAWLHDNEARLFPKGWKAGYFWTQFGTRFAQHQYWKMRPGLDMMLYGRTHADGNNIPLDGVMTDVLGLHYSPMRDWAWIETLGLLYYYNQPMPPTYGWERGWKTGTGPWAGWQGFATRRNGWAYLYKIDPDMVHRAARAGIHSAVEFFAAALGGVYAAD